MIVSGSSTQDLSSLLSTHLNNELVLPEIRTFPNGETYARVSDHLRGHSVILMQSMYGEVNELFVETLLLVDALERVGVEKLTLVLPWMGYSLQDKSFQPGEACSAAVLGKVLKSPILTAIVSVDLHQPHISEYFSLPVINVLPDEAINTALKQYVKSEFVIVAPDKGARSRATAVAKHSEVEYLVLDKTRVGLSTSVTGDASLVKGKSAIVIDDIINTGSTCKTVTSHLKQAGAAQVWWVATHGLFTGNAKQNLEQSGLDAVLISNTTEPPLESIPSNVKIHRFDVSGLIANKLRELDVV